MPSISIDRLNGASGALGAKAPVSVATTSNIALSGLQTIDGRVMAELERVLVHNQSNAIENGIYLASSGQWVRSSDFDGSVDAVKGTSIAVANGSVYGGGRFRVDTNGLIIGITVVNFILEVAGSGGGGGSEEATERFQNVAAMIAAATISIGVIVETLSFNTPGDRGHNRYEIEAAGSGTADGYERININGRQAVALFPDMWRRPEQYGAPINGTSDATVAVKACLASGAPVEFTRIFYITDEVQAQSGQLVRGIGQNASGIRVAASFNMSANSMLGFEAVEPGPNVQDFGIFAYQDAGNSVRANCIEYPRAIDARSCPRFFINNLRMEKVWLGIDATGNSGGCHVSNVESSALYKTLAFNGSLDFMYVDAVEAWPFGFPGTNLFNDVWSDGETVNIDCLNSDGVAFGRIGGFRAKTVISASFGTIGTFLGDGDYSNLHITGGGNIEIGTFYSTSAAADDFALKVDGSDTHVTIASANISNATNLTSNGLIQLLGATAELVISGLHLKTSGTDTRVLYQTAGTSMISNVFFQAPQSVNLPNAQFDVLGGEINLSNMRVLDKGTGTGDILNLAENVRHTITGVTAPGWTVGLPGSSSNMNFANNNWDGPANSGGGGGAALPISAFDVNITDASNIVTATVLEGAIAEIQNNTLVNLGLTGNNTGVINTHTSQIAALQSAGGQLFGQVNSTFDGSGNSAGIAHGITNLHTRIRTMTMFASNGGARQDISQYGNLFIDAVNFTANTGNSAFSGHTCEIKFYYV